MKKYLSALFADHHGCPSSKRIIIFLSIILMSVGYLANLFGGYTVDHYMFDAIMYVVIGGMGITGVEKFAPKPPTNDENA